jgi:hypothetical protein
VELRRVRDELVHREQDEVRSIVHVDGTHPVHRGARGHAHHAFLRERRIEHACAAVLGVQPFRRPEHAAGIVYALAEHENIRVGRQCEIERLAQGSGVTQHASFARIWRVIDERVDESFIPRHAILLSSAGDATRRLPGVHVSV